MKKKILFLINSLHGGGAEKVLIDMVNNLNKEKYSITVQTLYNDSMSREVLNDNIRKKTIIKLKKKWAKKVASYIIHNILPSSFTYKFFIKDNYDIEIAFLEGLPMKLISHSNSDAQKYTWVHIDLYNYDHNKKLFSNFEEYKRCYQKFDKIFCVSEAVKAMFEKKFGISKNVYVQYNVIDEKNIKKLSNETVDMPYKNKTVLLSVGRLVHQKGYDRLIEAAKMLNVDGYEFKLLILGEGAEESKLRKMIQDYGMTECIKLIGFQKNPYKYIRYSDIFVCSSRAEGFSTVATEAIILGKPIIATNCAGMNELLGESEYGLLVENNTNALYNGLRKMLCDEKIRAYYREKAVERAEKFSLNNRITEIERILDCEE